MKTNCKISKIVASLLVMSTILCFGVTGFASAASYSTVTTYNLDAEGTVDITSTVTGIGATEQVTYLATNGDGDIIYVDQDDAEDIGSGVIGKVFSYTTTTAKIGTGTTSVKFGATTTTGITPNLATDGMISTVDVAVTAGNSTVSVNTTDVSTGFTVGLGQSVDFTVTADDGYEVTAVSVNGDSQTLPSTTFTIDTEDVVSPSIVITTQEIDVDPDLSATTVLSDNFLDEDVTLREFTLYSKLTLEPSKLNDETTDYGIIVLMSERMSPSFADLMAFGTKYRAYGYGTGNMFAVCLRRGVGENAVSSSGKPIFVAGQTYVMAPYLTVDGETVYGDMQTLTIPE